MAESRKPSNKSSGTRSTARAAEPAADGTPETVTAALEQPEAFRYDYPPELAAILGASGALRASHSRELVGTDGNRLSRCSKILDPHGDNDWFLSSIKGYSQFNIWNVGPDCEAEVILSWVDRDNKPCRGQVVICGVGRSEFYSDLFQGAKVNITNQSQGARVVVTSSLG